MDDRAQELLVERHGAVLEITLNRPKVNAIDFDLSRWTPANSNWTTGGKPTQTCLAGLRD